MALSVEQQEPRMNDLLGGTDCDRKIVAANGPDG